MTEAAGHGLRVILVSLLIGFASTTSSVSPTDKSVTVSTNMDGLVTSNETGSAGLVTLMGTGQELGQVRTFNHKLF